MTLTTASKPIIRITLSLLVCLFSAAVSPHDLRAEASEPLNIGYRLELFVDDFLIDAMKGTTLQLNPPVPREVAITFDKPWEGSTSTYVTVFQDGDLFRMYYRGSDYDPKTKKSSKQTVCYAESKDAVHWNRPDLDLVEFNGSKKNNIVWQGIGDHNFAPFKDANPACTPDARYKALASGGKGLVAFKSPDAIHWALIQDAPVITKGAFDSQNLGFWDTFRNQYVDFHRGFRNGVRDIMTCTSKDFLTWTEPQWLDWGTTPPEHLYTNAVTAYYRAPHIFVGFPKRFMPSRRIGAHPAPGVSDGVFMTSRDGLHWKRWVEAFLRPGLQKERWVNRNNMIAWGILVTKADQPGLPDELSIYSTEGYYVGPCKLRRHTLRQDGFVSVNAPYAGGEMITKPFLFTGKNLVINHATSAAGSLRVEIQDPAGKTLAGFALADCPEIFGDEIERTVAWKAGADLSALAGKPIRLRFTMKDADLYSIRFR